MSYLTKHLRQSAAFWKRSGVDASGDTSFDAAKAIKVRWEDRTVVFTNPSGQEGSATSVIFVGEDMKPGDFLFLGTSTTADPTTVTGAQEVQGFSKILQLAGAGFERKAFLSARG